MWLGVRGVAWQPIVVTVRDSGNPETEGRHCLALVAQPERLLQASEDQMVPSRGAWYLAAQRLPEALLRLLRW